MVETTKVGYLIDTPKREIREVEYAGTNTEIYQALGFDCKSFRGIILNRYGDVLYVDGDALIKAQTNLDLRKLMFSHRRYHSMLIGRGFVLGHDEEGFETDRPHTTLEVLTKEITFHD